MRTIRSKILSTFIFGLLACWEAHAGEQDNWYLAKEWSLDSAKGVAYYEDNATGIGQIYVVCENGNQGIKVYDLNGSLARSIPIASNQRYPRDLVLDENGTIYVAEWYAVTCLDNNGSFKWRKGRSASISNYGSSGSENGEFRDSVGITIGSDGNLYVADYNNHRIQVLDRNGSFIRKFGSYGSAPGQLRYPHDITPLENGAIVVGDSHYLHFFEQDGTFIKRVNTSSARQYVSLANDGSLFSYQRLRDQDGNQIAYLNNISSGARTCFTPEADLIVSYNNKVQIWKRAYRTKGLLTRNVIPQPAIRSISQRSGTNIIDIDFEIVDPDDTNATVGILAAIDGNFNDTTKWIVPKAWIEGTDLKIGASISTNQSHRVSWDVKQDWIQNTGTLKFEVFCQDGHRKAPIDIHFLTLPFADENMTISRSPVRNSELENYAKFLISTDQASFNSSAIFANNPPNGLSNSFIFRTCGKTGRFGPTSDDINATYAGTNLEGNVSLIMQGIQKWQVPRTGTYLIEATGASGGTQPEYNKGGKGVFISGRFQLNAGDNLLIAVGQMGLNTQTNDNEGGGGGGSFIAKGSEISTAVPLLIAGGGGGDGSDSVGANATDSNVTYGNSNAGNAGGGDNGGGGFYTSASGNRGGKGFRQGLAGGEGENNHGDGGFGGGSGGINERGSSGGGYTGGVSGDSTGKGGAGSFNSGFNNTSATLTSTGNGIVRITEITEDFNSTSLPPLEAIGSMLLSSDRKSTPRLRYELIRSLGPNYQIATTVEVNKARKQQLPAG